MAGFFKKLIGKKEQETPQRDEGGSWTEHEISVDIQADDGIQDSQDDSVRLLDQNSQIFTEPSQASPLEPDHIADTQPVGTIIQEKVETKAPEQRQKSEQFVDTVQIPVVEIATLDPADLKYAMDQVERPKEVDPLDEITAQIQSELAAEKSEKEKKATLEKLKEVTSKLRRPDFDEDFDV